MLKADSLFELLLGEDFIKPIFLLGFLFCFQSLPVCLSVLITMVKYYLVVMWKKDRSHSVILRFT